MVLLFDGLQPAGWDKKVDYLAHVIGKVRGWGGDCGGQRVWLLHDL